MRTKLWLERLPGRGRHRSEDNIKMGSYGSVVWIYMGHERGALTGLCEHGNELLVP